VGPHVLYTLPLISICKHSCPDRARGWRCAGSPASGLARHSAHPYASCTPCRAAAARLTLPRLLLPPRDMRRAPAQGEFYGFPSCHTNGSGDPYLRPPGPGSLTPDPGLNKGQKKLNCSGASAVRDKGAAWLGDVGGDGRVWVASHGHVAAGWKGAGIVDSRHIRCRYRAMQQLPLMHPAAPAV
jgi:hypothetical protein